MTGGEPEWVTASQIAKMFRIPKGIWLAAVATNSAPPPVLMKRPGPKTYRWKREDAIKWYRNAINRSFQRLYGKKPLTLPN